MRPRGFHLSIGLLVAAAGCQAGDRGGASIDTPGFAPPIIQALVSRVEAADVPDFGMLPDDRAIPVLLPEEFQDLRPPRVVGYELEFVSSAELVARAQARDADLPFLRVDRPRKVVNDWLVPMGVALQLAEPSDLVLCCCVGTAVFNDVQGELRFLRWDDMVCS